MGVLYILNPLHSHKKSYDVTDVSTISKEIYSAEEKYQKGEKEPVWKCRYVVVLVGFFVYFYLNAYRTSMSVNIVAMVNSSALVQVNKTESVSCLHLKENSSEFQNETDTEKEGDFTWSSEVQGYFISSYFIGYSIAPIPVGSLIERYGCKWFLFAGSFISGVGTLLVPAVSWLDVYALFALQTLRGLSQGVVPPSLTLLTANWFPKLERGFYFTIMQSGAAMGSCLGSLFAGFLCDSSGRWPSSFYAFGVGGILLSAVILFFIVEGPNEHRNISKAELNFILSNQETTLKKRRPSPPWGKIVRSVPVYAAAFGCFGQLWAISQFMLVHSTFLGTILHYPIAQNGLLSAAPFLLQFLCSQIGGWVSSFMLRKKFAGVDFLRKFFNFISCLGYSGCLLGIYFAGCDRDLSSIFSVLSTGFTGFGFAGAFIISADMSPKFAGTMMAICCTSACLSSVILPVIVGYVTEGMQTIEQWNKVFFITIAVVLSSGIVFAVFGSAEVQPWNYDDDDDAATDEGEKHEKHTDSVKKIEMNMVEESQHDRVKSVDKEIKLTKF